MQVTHHGRTSSPLRDAFSLLQYHICVTLGTLPGSKLSGRNQAPGSNGRSRESANETARCVGEDRGREASDPLVASSVHSPVLLDSTEDSIDQIARRVHRMVECPWLRTAAPGGDDGRRTDVGETVRNGAGVVDPVPDHRNAGTLPARLNANSWRFRKVPEKQLRDRRFARKRGLNDRGEDSLSWRDRVTTPIGCSHWRSPVREPNPVEKTWINRENRLAGEN